MKKIVLVFGFIGVIGALTSQETLSWDVVAARVSAHQSVELASSSVRIARSELQSEEAWNGVRLSVQPIAEYEDPLGVNELAQVRVGADLVIPLGITSAEREKIMLLEDFRTLRDNELALAYGQSFLDLFRRYVGVYIAQEAVRASEAEFELESVRIKAIQQRDLQGLLPVSAALEAEDDYKNAETALTQARLDVRLAWFNLAYAANIEAVRDEHEKGSQSPLGVVPALEYPELSLNHETLAQPAELIALAKANSPAALQQRQRIAAVERELASASFADFSIAPKVEYGMEDISVSLGFNSESGSISLGTDWTAFKPESLPSASQTVPQSLTLSLLVSADMDGGNAARREALSEQLSLERRKLEYLEASAELLVRSRYAAYLKALDSVKESARTFETSRALEDTLEAKKKIGQTSPADEAASRALSVRYAYNADKSRVLLSLAYLELMDAAYAWETTELALWGKK